LNTYLAAPWAVTSDGILLTLRLTPKGGRDAVEGIEQMADGRAILKARVRAAATGGEANAALTRLIADALAVSPSRVTLIAGASARIKRLKIVGDSAVLVARLRKISGAAE
jgi:uncharacterized protein YggU (UPF0235/DUF167 family)